MTAAMFLAFILFLILSFPVAIAMGLSSCVPALIDSSFSADFVYIIRTMVVCYVLRLRPVFFTVQSPVLVRQPVPL